MTDTVENDADALFHAIGTFVLSARQSFVLYGHVERGTVRAGMVLLVPLSNVSVSERIHAVEFVRKDGIEYVALVIRCDDADELSFWESLDISDERLAVRKRRGGD